MKNRLFYSLVTFLFLFPHYRQVRKNEPPLEFVEGGYFFYEAHEYKNKMRLKVFVSDFYCSKYKITNKEFNQFVEETGYSCQENFNLPPDVPAFVTWHSANEYCRWLSKKTGDNYRLPTIVEWQYAAKGGQLSKGYIYPGSNDLSDIADSLRYYAVGTKLPNELNLHDMFGIQYEWNCDNSYLPLEHFLKNNSDEKTTVENPYFFCFYGEGLDKRSKTYSGFRWFKNDAKYAYLHSSRITIDDANFNFRVVKVFHKLDTITFPIQKK